MFTFRQKMMRLRARQLAIIACIAFLAITAIVQLFSMFTQRPPEHDNKHRTINIKVDASGHVHHQLRVKKGEENVDQDDTDLEELFELRRRHAYRACSARGKTDFETFKNATKSPYDSTSWKWLFVDEVHKMVLCNVPKAASTNWKKLLVVLTNTTNATSPNDIKTEFVNRDANEMKDWVNFRPLWWYSGENATRILKTYLKVIWVRDPYKRLVSAWRSKFFSQNRYYNRVGRVIIRWYRPNATATEKRTGYPVTFAEFLTYVRDQALKSRYDVHWNLMSEFCFLCKIPYDYIGQYENLIPEANFLLKKITGRDDIKFPTKDALQRANPLIDANYTRIMDTVPRKLLKETLSAFHQDYDIFGYEWPKYLIP